MKRTASKTRLRTHSPGSSAIQRRHRSDARSAAQSTGLRDVSDSSPGFRRVRCGAGFRYLKPDGTRLTRKHALARIKALAIPPAWEDVWICPLENGHLQANGRDAKHRKQSRSHAQWQAVRDATKHDRLLAFGQALPRLHRRIRKDLARPELDREKVLATVVQLLETTLIRVGNEEYARDNGSFGLTTMHSSHVEVSGSHLRFEFCGKSGVSHSIDVRDPRVARIVRRCQELPGQPLFQYLDENGERHDVDSSDVNDYLREVTGEDFTSKDFRTWSATAFAANLLQRAGTAASPADAQRQLAQALEQVARQLGNTKAVCRKCYVHPVVQSAFEDGSLRKAFNAARRNRPTALRSLNLAEAAVMILFRRQRPKFKESRLTRRST